MISSSPVPPEGRRYMRVSSPKVGHPVKVICLSSAVVGAWTHWVDGRTHPCLTQACPWCTAPQPLPKRWKGYVMGHDVALRTSVLLEIPADTVRAHIQLRDARVNLTGATITLERVGPHVNSAVRATVRIVDTPALKPAQEPDILKHLAQIWGIAPIDERASVNPEDDQ